MKSYTHNEIPTGNVIAKARIFSAVKEMKDIGKYCFSEFLSTYFASDCLDESRCLPGPTFARARPGNLQDP